MSRALGSKSHDNLFYIVYDFRCSISAASSHPSPVFQPTSVGAVDLNDVTWSKFMAFRADYFSVGGMLAALRGDI